MAQSPGKRSLVRADFFWGQCPQIPCRRARSAPVFISSLSVCPLLRRDFAALESPLCCGWIETAGLARRVAPRATSRQHTLTRKPAPIRRFCTLRRKSARNLFTHRAAPRVYIGPRRYAPYGNIRHISTTAVPRTCPPWWTTTTHSST
jgi:hypothetical protein